MTTEIAAIREAILRGAPGEEIGALPLPDDGAGRAREGRRAGDVRRASSRPTRTRASRSTSRSSRCPELAPDEAFVAVMASAINFNTVWTSIFEPLPTFGFLKRLGRESVWGKRHDQPYHVIGSDARGRRAAGRLGGAQLEAGRRRDRALPARRRPGPVGARRLDDGDEPAHLGLRDELRRPRRDRGREGEPADAEARAPHVGRGGVQRALQLHELPHDRQQERLADDAGSSGAHLGRDRRHRRVRDAVRAQRRRHAGRRGVVGEARRGVARDGLRGGHRPARRGLQVLERRRHRAGPGGVVAARQEDPRASSGATSTSCSSTPAGRRWARRCSSPSAAG